MLMSKISAVGEAGVFRANGTLVVRAEVKVRTGLVPVKVPVKEARAPELTPTSWLFVKAAAAEFVPPPASPSRDQDATPAPSVVIGKPLVPGLLGSLNVHVPAASWDCVVTIPLVVPTYFNCPVAPAAVPMERAG